MKKTLYLAIILAAGIISSCSKSNKVTPVTPGGGGSTVGASTLDLIRDSIFYYAKEDYLWYDALPTYASFNPRSFTGASDIVALQAEVNAISQLKINPETGLAYEYSPDDKGVAKYSFIDDGAVSAELNGVKGDFGFAPFYGDPNDLSDLRVKYIYPGSPAGLAGIKRGYRIMSINDNPNISYDAPGFGSGSSTNLNFVINAYSNSSTIKMVLKKFDGSLLTVNLTTANYTVNPVLKDTVYDAGNSRKIGYMVFNSFTSPDNADPKIDLAFANFESAGVTDLVIDLRYNGGGYVSTAEYIDNKIVPVAKNNTLMYNTYYNTNMVSGNDPLLKNQVRKDPSSGQVYNYGQFSYTVADNAVNFNKTNTFSPAHVYFIITGSTASASELTINNLRPLMDVQFIGETSYGKPVGFFDIDINKYQMYIPEFYVQNSASQGGYYGGFTPGAAGYPGIQDYDDVTKDFGDPTEGLLAHVFNYVKNGTYAVKGPVIQSTKSGTYFSHADVKYMAMAMDKHKFTGMVFNKKLTTTAKFKKK